MTEHKLTDEEVIKALECCIKTDHFGDCFWNDCPFVSEHGCKVGKETLYPYVLAIINRQKAEIAFWQDAAANAKKEAIKEFADRLKKYYGNLNSNTAAGLVEYHIDQIAKEMIGDQ